MRDRFTSIDSPELVQSQERFKGAVNAASLSEQWSEWCLDWWSVWWFLQTVPVPMWGEQRQTMWGQPIKLKKSLTLYILYIDIEIKLFSRDVCQHIYGIAWGPWRAGLCLTDESWVKFDSTLTQLNRVRVESAVNTKDMSWVRVESRWSSLESELSILKTAEWKLSQLFFWIENVKILHLSVALQEKNQPTATFDCTPSSLRSTTFWPN